MYDRTEIYKKHIEQKAIELNEMCKAYGVAMFMSFCVKDDGTKTDYQNFVNGSASNGFKFVDDRLRRHINVANGFETVPPDEETSIDDYMRDV